MSKDKLNNAKDRGTARSLLPLVALGGGLAATPAAALELGELAVHSNLGQPLRASIAYALAPSEMLSNTCVTVSAGPTTSGLPGIGANAVRITERAIVISGQSSIREPMLATRVTIDCPYTPNLSREYMLLVDPPFMADSRVASPATNVPLARPEPAPVSRPEPAPVSRPAPAPVAQPEAAPVNRTTTVPVARPEATPVSEPVTATPVRRAPVNNTPIGQSTRYQVQPGDSLSEIVARIQNRSMSLWPAVNLVFAANPDAFIDNDPNKLKAGSWLTIPSLDGTAPVVNTATPEPVASPVEIPAPAADLSATAEEPVSALDSAVFDDSGRAAGEPVVQDATADLMPGDAVAEISLAPADEPVVVPDTAIDAPQASSAAPSETIVIPDTELEGPQTTSSSPNVPTAIVSTGTRSESSSLLVWLVGGGLALILALLLFGRRARERFGTEPVSRLEPDLDDYRDDDALATAGEAEAESAMHFDIEDNSPTDENLSLDADLVAGTGLEEGDMAVAHDFGFAETTGIDLDLPFAPESDIDVSASIIDPISGDLDVESILDSEVLPEPDDAEDVAIGGETVETVRMPLSEVEETAPGLEAIDEHDVMSMLEKDYEDELTATQVINQEIEQVAAELTGDFEMVEDTSEMPLATVTELDRTAELPRKDAEERKDTDETAEFEATYDPNDTNALTVSMTDDEETNRMPVANDDDTIEMDIEGGKVDTRKR